MKASENSEYKKTHTQIQTDDEKGKEKKKVVKAPKTTESSNTTPARTLTNRHDEIVIIHKN